MGKRVVVTVDWLRKGRMVDDLTILRDLITDSSEWNLETATLDESLFERRFGLTPLPKRPSTEAALNRALGYGEVTEEVTTKMRPLSPVGTTVLRQVKSLFPKNLSKSEEKSLSYVFSRFVLEDTPKDTDWPLVPEGLDSLSSALFTIKMVSNIIDGEIPWLPYLWSMKVEEYRLDSLQKIHDSLISEKALEQVIEDIENTQDALKETLIQNPSIDKSLAPQDPLSDTIDRWLSILRGERGHTRGQIEATCQRLAADVLEQVQVRRGAGFVSLEEVDLQKVTLTQWNIHDLRPDGPTATEFEPMLKMFRASINILDYELLVRICEYLSDCERAGRPSASDIERVTNTKRRMSHYLLQRIAFILTERYLLTLPKLGLRYRFIFTQKQKPTIWSSGLVERIVLSESTYKGCSVHIEPETSVGPSEQSPPESIEVCADRELLSLRMDLYDKHSGSWNLEPWKPASGSPGRTPSWLLRETEYHKEPSVNPTDRQIDLIGPTLAFRGLRASRMWMMKRMGFVPRTARRYLKRLLDARVLRLLYTPTLEYCGLQEGMVVAAVFNDRLSRESFIDWMTSRLPYVRVFTDKSENMVAYLRLPSYKTDVVGGVIREKLSGGSKKDRITTEAFTARLRSYKTYQMTVLQRLSQESGWLDPWKE
jgi:hypothetical protein